MYFSEDDTSHLINTLQICYNITIDKTWSKFYGLHLEWNYEHHWVDISMPKYVLKMVQKLEHPSSAKNRHVPHRWVNKTYEKKVHLIPTTDTSELLTQEEVTHIQCIVESFIYYTRAVDNTILTTVNEIAATQASPSK